MYTSTRREYWEYNICMYACMYACILYVCMYVRYSASRSLFGAMGDMDVSQVEYACIVNVCIYRRADSTGNTIYYVCMHACMYVLCMYVCMYSNRRAIRRADR